MDSSKTEQLEGVNILSKLGSGAQADVFLAEKQRKSLVVKVVGRELGLDNLTANLLLNGHNEYLTLLDTAGIKRIPVLKSFVYSPNNTLIICEEYARTPDLQVELEQSIEKNDWESVKLIFRLFSRYLLNLNPYNAEFSCESPWVKAPADFKLDNYIFEEGNFTLIDTFGPKMWKTSPEEGLVSFPLIDEAFPLTFAAPLCGDLRFIVGRFYRSFIRTLDKYNAYEFCELNDFQAILQEEVQNSPIKDSSFTDILIDNISTNFIFVQELYDQLAAYKQNREAL